VANWHSDRDLWGRSVAAPDRELTHLVEEIWVLLAEEIRGEEEGWLEDDVSQRGEHPPAQEQAVGLG